MSTVLPFLQIEQLWVNNGGSVAMAPLMAGIAESESGGNPTATNPSGATGLWQIEWPLHRGIVPGATSQAALMDPNTNAAAAVKIAGANGAGIRSGWGAQPGMPSGDGAWASWASAGFPQWPTAAQVVSWGWGGNASSSAGAVATSIIGPNGPLAPGVGGNEPGGSTADTAAGEPHAQSIPSYTCSGGNGPGAELGGADILGTHIGTKCQIKALTGGLLVGLGGSVLVLGALLIAAYGLGQSKTGQAATQLISKAPGPVGTTAKVARTVGA